MPEVLELTQLSQRQRVAEVQVRAGRIDAELDPKRPAERELLAQLCFADDLRGALLGEN